MATCPDGGDVMVSSYVAVNNADQVATKRAYGYLWVYARRMCIMPCVVVCVFASGLQFSRRLIATKPQAHISERG